MYELFKNIAPVANPQRTVPDFLYVKNGLARENAKLVSHYRRNPTAVNSDHILVRILDSIAVSYSSAPELHLSQVRALSYNLAMHLKITSPHAPGKVFTKGYFYGKQTKELILAVDEPFDIDNIDTNWRDLRPIKVLQHGMTQMVPPLLDGKKNIQEGGYVVIQINIPMLSCQYQAWRRAVATKQVIPLSVSHFVRTYPIVNMIYSHQDYALFNRLNAIDTALPVAKWTQMHSFPYLDYQRRTDDCLAKYLGIVYNRRQSYQELFSSLPSASTTDMLETMQLPDLPPVRQVEWLLNITRLPAIAFLLRVDAETRTSENTMTKNQLRQSLRSLRSDKTIDSVLDSASVGRINNYIKTNIEKYL